MIEDIHHILEGALTQSGASVAAVVDREGTLLDCAVQILADLESWCIELALVVPRVESFCSASAEDLVEFWIGTAHWTWMVRPMAGAWLLIMAQSQNLPAGRMRFGACTTAVSLAPLLAAAELDAPGAAH